MKKKNIFILVILSIGFAVSAEEKKVPEKLSFIPSVTYTQILLPDVKMYAPSFSFMAFPGTHFFVMGGYTRTQLEQERQTDWYNDLSLTLRYSFGKNSITLGGFSNIKDETTPCQDNFSGVFIYSRQMVRKTDLNVELGLGGYYTGSGLNLAGDSVLYGIPFVYFNIRYQRDRYFKAGLGFQNGFGANIQFFPDSPLCCDLSASVNDFENMENIAFNAGLSYRIGMSARQPPWLIMTAGVKSDEKKFVYDTDAKQKYYLYEAYGTVSFMHILDLTGGYVFHSKEFYNGDYQNTAGTGAFFTASIKQYF